MELVTEAADKREDMGRAPTTSLTIRISGRGAWESALLTPDDSNIHKSLRTTALKGNLIRLPPCSNTFRESKVFSIALSPPGSGLFQSL